MKYFHFTQFFFLSFLFFFIFVKLSNHFNPWLGIVPIHERSVYLLQNRLSF